MCQLPLYNVKNKPLSQSRAVHSNGPLDNQTWQTVWKTAPLATLQLCEKENQTFEASVEVSQFVYQVGLFSGPPKLLATVHDCETGLRVLQG